MAPRVWSNPDSNPIKIVGIFLRTCHRILRFPDNRSNQKISASSRTFRYRSCRWKKHWNWLDFLLPPHLPLPCPILTLNFLPCIISAEARGEPYIGQVAVGAVVLNRVESSSFPDSISGVVYQPGAFTALRMDRLMKLSPNRRVAPPEALNGFQVQLVVQL